MSGLRFLLQGIAIAIVVLVLAAALFGRGPSHDVITKQDALGQCWYKQPGQAWTQFPCGETP